jgi:hypothetical protein
MGALRVLPNRWSPRQPPQVRVIAEVQGPPPGRERRWLCTDIGRETANATREVVPRSYTMNEAVARSGAHLIGTNDVGITLAR